MREALLQWNPWWHDPDWREEWITREYYLNQCLSFINKKILVLFGIRRAGKTFIMYQLIRKILDTGVSGAKIVYVNLEDERYPSDSSALDKILNTYYEITGEAKGFYLFVDEIQQLENWGGYLRRFTDLRKDVKVIISGSSSRLLEPEIATKLTGRRMEIPVWPFSFKEYLKTKGIDLGRDPYIRFGGEQGAVIHHLLNYMKFGGFPEVVLEKSIMGKLKYLNSYFSDIINKDIAERHTVNLRKIKDLTKFLLENIGNPVNITKLAKYLDISKPTLYDYLSYLEEVFMIFLVDFFSFGKEKMIRPKKIYAIDTGLRNAVSRTSRDIGRQAENLVFLHLKKFTDEIYYLKNKDKEIDFVAKINGKIWLIESKWEVKKTEKLDHLDLTAKEFNAYKLIVTKDRLGNNMIPLWLFLLTKPNEWLKYSKF